MKDVLDSYDRVSLEFIGNSNSLHELGLNSKRIEEAASRQILDVLGLDDYDVIYLGYPIWWYKEPMAVDAFLENYDLSEKTIIPFCTSTSSSIDESVQSIQKICPHSHVLEGLRMEQANEKEIDEWLKKINIGG